VNLLTPRSAFASRCWSGSCRTDTPTPRSRLLLEFITQIEEAIAEAQLLTQGSLTVEPPVNQLVRRSIRMVEAMRLEISHRRQVASAELIARQHATEAEELVNSPV